MRLHPPTAPIDLVLVGVDQVRLGMPDQLRRQLQQGVRRDQVVLVHEGHEVAAGEGEG